MRKTILGVLLCMASAMFLCTCKKTVPNQDSQIELISNDTQLLQSQLDAGEVTLAAGKTYHITGLNITHSLNLNGATINLINTNPAGFALKITAPGVQVTNGTITGSWNNQTPGNSYGYSGIIILAGNCAVSHVNISAFSAYGIIANAYDSVSVTHCNISNTGYIGYFFDAQSVSTKGGEFSNNIVDRSMLPPSTIQQMAIGIRGSVLNKNIATSGWTISNNILKMPVNPLDLSAQGMELRNCNNAHISNNTTTAGSIGISMVNCTGNTVSANTCSNASQEGIEYADCNTCVGQNNVISGSGNVGELIDGAIGCNGIQINGDKISGTAQECIHAYYHTQNLTISGCTLSASGPNTYTINLQNANFVKVVNSNINGNGIAAAVIALDNCPGNLQLNGGSISGFKYSVVYVYNSTSGLITNNISMLGVTVTDVPQGLTYDLSNGGALGSNISVNL